MIWKKGNKKIKDLTGFIRFAFFQQPSGKEGVLFNFFLKIYTAEHCLKRTGATSALSRAAE